MPETEFTPVLQDRVIVRPEYATDARVAGKVFTVVDKKRVNVVIEEVGNPANRLRIAPFMLMPAPKDATTPDGTAVIGQPFQRWLHAGEVVRVDNPLPTWKEDRDQLFVVLRHKGDGKVSLAYFGGNERGRYYPSIPRQFVKPINDDDDVRMVLVGGIARHFTGLELDGLARTAGELHASAGDPDDDLSSQQVALAERAYKLHLADVGYGDDEINEEVNDKG